MYLRNFFFSVCLNVYHLLIVSLEKIYINSKIYIFSVLGDSFLNKKATSVIFCTL